MLFKKDELRHLWPFYCYLLVFGLSAVVQPFCILYFLGLGYSYFKVSIIMSSAGLAAFFFEIPTGAFADGYSRKYSVVIGCLIVAISVVLIPYTTNFYLTLLLYMITGIGTTFMSGAEESLVIDNLNQEKRPDLHQEYFIKSNSFMSLGAIFAPMLGAVLVQGYSLKILWFVYGFSFFFAAIVMTLFTKEYFKPKKMKVAAMFKKSFHTSKISIAFTIRQKTLFFSIIASIFMLIMQAGSMGTQPFLISLGMKEYQLGYVYSIISVLCIIMSFASRLFTRFEPKHVVSIILIVIVILLFSLAFVHPPFFLIASIIIILKSSMLNLGAPIIQTYIHQFIPQRIRATTLSTFSMVTQLVTTVAGLATGFCLDIFGPQKIIVFSGIFGFAAIFFYQKMQKSTSVNAKSPIL